MASSLKQTNTKKTILYNSYAWGFPTLLLIITIMIDKVSDVEERMKPGIGKRKCWFQGKISSYLNMFSWFNFIRISEFLDKLPEFLYFQGPLFVLLVMNMFFFVTTAIKIVRLKRETAMLTSGESRTHNRENEQKKQRYHFFYTNSDFFF